MNKEQTALGSVSVSHRPPPLLAQRPPTLTLPLQGGGNSCSLSPGGLS